MALNLDADGVRQYQYKTIATLAVVLCFGSFIAFAINHFKYHYSGNNYFPPQAAPMAIVLLLIYLGCYLITFSTNRATNIARDILLFYMSMALIALATNAVQYTPFPTIDEKILIIEHGLHINLSSIITWTYSHTHLKNCLIFAYDCLPYQMACIPLILIATRRTEILNEYYILLLITTLIGFIFYYFFPTTAPASMINNMNFSDSQMATGLKFQQIHNHIAPSTLDGGLIAFPSFHVIWAWLCLFLLRKWPVAFLICMPINLLIVIACVLLGWHYPTDLFGSLLTLGLAYGFCIMQRTTAKRCKSGSKDHAAIQQVSIFNNTVS